MGKKSINPISHSNISILLSKGFLLFLSISLLSFSISVSTSQKKEELKQLHTLTQATSLALIREVETNYRRIYTALSQLSLQDYKANQDNWKQNAQYLGNTTDAIVSIIRTDKASNIQYAYTDKQQQATLDRINLKNTPMTEENFPIFDRFTLQGNIQAIINLEALCKPFEIENSGQFLFQLLKGDNVVYSSPNWVDIQNGIRIEQSLSIQDVQNLTLVCAPSPQSQRTLLYRYFEIQLVSFLLSFMACVTVFFAQRFYKYFKLNELRFHTLLDDVSLLAVILDMKGNITYCNDFFLAKTGWNKEEVIGTNYFNKFLPLEEQDLKKKIYSLITKGISFPYGEFPLLTKHKEIRWIQLNITMLKNTKGKIIGVAGLAEDITVRKSNENTLQKQFEFNKALFVVDQSITARKELDETLSLVLDQSIKQIGFDAGAILLFNTNNQCLEYKAGIGFKSKDIEQVCLPLGTGLAGMAALEKKAWLQNTLQTKQIDFIHTSIIEKEGFQKYWVVPLLVKGKVNGVFEAFWTTKSEFDASKADFFRALAQQTAIAIDSFTLFNKLQKSHAELFQAYDSTIEGWSQALDLRDKETQDHSLRVTEMTVALCRISGMSSRSLVHIRRGALLHDIGKMGIPDSILLKTDSLSESDWAIIKKHPDYAYALLYPIEYLRPALDIPYCHHEKWDGTGYPRGLKGEEIPLAARLFAVVDVWDALLSDRPYRKGWPQEKVYDYIQSLSGTHFDPDAVDLFLKTIKEQGENWK
ncbi:PAS domain S-box [Sphaerochaeta pleomorpha str. Grapes]|uniref:PAS domain S-box n=1 Tax=Sphaerochaeta pleomorpha (strain ATCC BAA-1885 / DSM 22778 / Grapes) TaxID=158190 RepID=G8QU70_SPHPG|nr:HD domain-containing phosphohydrolase [Sphaerochaeta pleomorpha]AEV28040.1 PAS domain S-box [Sphaerochaeta pleomorpha str. Grapes]